MKQNNRQDVTSSQHNTIENAFNACFAQSENTVLVGGASEPLYLPAGQAYDAHIALDASVFDTANNIEQSHVDVVSRFHRVFYRHDYPSSALHEIAHWCIAGDRRRQLLDYGYWYAPDGRTPAQQTQFAQVEARPQAIEKAFSLALGIPFNVSMDNLEAGNELDQVFEDAVNKAYQKYMQNGLPSRANLFLQYIEQQVLMQKLSERIAS